MTKPPPARVPPVSFVDLTVFLFKQPSPHSLPPPTTHTVITPPPSSTTSSSSYPTNPLPSLSYIAPTHLRNLVRILWTVEYHGALNCSRQKSVLMIGVHESAWPVTGSNYTVVSGSSGSVISRVLDFSMLVRRKAINFKVVYGVWWELGNSVGWGRSRRAGGGVAGQGWV